MHGIGDLLDAAFAAKRTMKFTWLDRPLNAGAAVSEATLVGVRCIPLGAVGYENDLDLIAREQGYTQRDEIHLSPLTPDLTRICATYSEEHRHTEDEVRFVVDGEGSFDVRSQDDDWIRIHVEPGDFLILPAGLYHRFHLTETKDIRVIRMFKDKQGWTPIYRGE